MHGPTNNKPVINCCIWLVDSFKCVKMHGPTNPKFKNFAFHHKNYIHLHHYLLKMEQIW